LAGFALWPRLGNDYLHRYHSCYLGYSFSPAFSQARAEITKEQAAIILNRNSEQDMKKSGDQKPKETDSKNAILQQSKAESKASYI
jgi:hypothetical protein